MKFLKNLSYQTKRTITIVCVGVCFVVGISTITNGLNKPNEAKNMEINTIKTELESIILEKDKEINVLSLRVHGLQNKIDDLTNSYNNNLLESTKEKTFVTAIDKGYVEAVKLHCEKDCKCNGDANYPLHLFTIAIKSPHNNIIYTYDNVINPIVYSPQDIEAGDKIGEMYNSSFTKVTKEYINKY